MPVDDISFWSPYKAFVEVSGADATPFLQRLTTRDVTKAKGVFANCFLNQKGRLVDVVWQEELEPNRWLLMSSHETPEKLISWLEQYWFSEDLSVIPAEAGIQSDNLKAYVDASLRWHDKRVAKLLPKSPSEITDRFNPLEIGLRELIDENKGCYIGQEVIARLLTYSKVTKILVSLGCKREDFENLCKAPEVTSSLDKYVEGEPVALAVIKKTALTTESFFTTSGVPAWVVSSAR